VKLVISVGWHEIPDQIGKCDECLGSATHEHLGLKKFVRPMVAKIPEHCLDELK